jgi:hypothetical protein
VIKKFARSSGDGIQFERRSLHALTFTLEYIKNEIWNKNDHQSSSIETNHEIYSYVMDRLRALSVDLASCDTQRILLYIKLLRFYILIFYECLTQKFTVSISEHIFERSLHQREIANTISSILSMKDQLTSFPVEVKNLLNYIILKFSCIYNLFLN